MNRFSGIFVLLLCLCWGPAAAATIDGTGAGLKYFKNYTPVEYDHHPQNWAVTQDSRGLIYVANQGALMEYDGVSWRLIYVPNMNVRSLAVDDTDTLYIGGKNEIGYVSLADDGGRHYTSLTNRLPENKRNFGNTWNTIATPEGVYFRTSRYLLRWNPATQKMSLWTAEKYFNGLYRCRGTVYIRKAGIGLLRIAGDSHELLPDGKVFADKKIYMMASYGADNRQILIGTRAKGFYLYDGKQARPFPTELDRYLTENKVYHGIRLASRSGEYALATRLGGLVVMDSAGKLTYVFARTSGLQNNNVKHVFEDSGGNLWLSLNRGLTKIEYNSPVTFYNDVNTGLIGLVLSVCRVPATKELYAGTTDGLFRLDPASQKFRPVAGLYGSSRSLLADRATILAATEGGIYQVRNSNPQKIYAGKAFFLLKSRQDPSRIWAGLENQLAELHRNEENNRWEVKRSLKGIKGEVNTIAEDPEGNPWLGLTGGKVIKIVSSAGETNGQPEIRNYHIPIEHPNKEVNVFYAAEHVIFATRRGIYRYDKANDRFIPDRTLGEPFAGGKGKDPVFRLTEEQNGHIWFHSGSRNYKAEPDPGNTVIVHSTPYLRIPLAQVNAITPDPDGKTVWFAGTAGLIRYDTEYKKNYRVNFAAQIREMYINGAPVLYDKEGAVYRPGKANPFAELSYGQRNLRFNFAAPYYEDESQNRYRVKLKGYDKDDPGWNEETEKNYINLDEGQYTLRVQARNIYHQTGKEAVIHFTIPTPIYRAWWAYVIYILILSMVSYLIVFRWRSIRLEREKRKLELQVRERTTEISSKNRLLENQAAQLKDHAEKLKEMDKVKSRFFANISHEFRTPLTLIMGPLEQMLTAKRGNDEKKKINHMLRSSRRLLSLINRLLDLSRFDSGKMKLQAGPHDIVAFLNGIVSAFYLLVQQNKLQIELKAPPEEIDVYIDTEKMEEVFYNLLLNAVKFTTPGGKITVTLTEAAEHIEISVRDTGIGIPKEQLAHIFDRFHRVESAGVERKAGTGIGLAITREIVLLHQGKIDVHSGEGEGTEFIIQLRRGREHLDPAEIAPPRPAHTPAGEPATLTDRFEIEEEEEETAGENDKPKEPEAKAKPLILVVEDNRQMRTYIREPLEHDYTVIEAADGSEGIEKAKNRIPDLIVSDIMMPGTDGYQLCRTLKKDIKTSHIPIVLLTARASEDSIVRGLETGADDYVTKPFSTKILLTRIKNLIELRRQLQLRIQRQKMLLPSEIEISSIDDAWLQELQSTIEKNMPDPDFNIDELCKALLMGRSTLFRKIQALTGETPNQFIQTYRLERAAQLLKANAGNITEVAFSVGFNSSAYFTKCFKERFHQLPSTYQATEAKSKKP